MNRKTGPRGGARHHAGLFCEPLHLRKLYGEISVFHNTLCYYFLYNMNIILN
jgi:hypothetical protein